MTNELKKNTSMRGNTMVIVLGLVAVVLAAGAYFMYSSNTNQASTNPAMMVEENTGDNSMTQEAGTSNSDGSMAADGGGESMMVDENGVKVFTLEAGGFYYKPNVIKVNKGDQVKVVINSVDMPHDFVVDDLDIKSEIYQAGESGFVEFTADTVGSYEFYCSVGQHRANGMVGILTVEE